MPSDTQAFDNDHENCDHNHIFIFSVFLGGNALPWLPATQLQREFIFPIFVF